MACLVKDLKINQIVGYGAYTTEERLRINAQGDYEVFPFYDEETCKAVIQNIKKGV